MPQRKVFIGILGIFFVFLLTSFLLSISPRIFLGAVEDPVLIDFKLSDITINTDEAVDSLTIYARASTTEVEGGVSVRVSLAPDNGCVGDDCWQPQAQAAYLSIMAEGCDVLEGFNIDGLEGGCGDEKDGIYSGTFEFPKYSAIGDWKVYSIMVDEGVGDQGLSVPISLDTLTATTQSGAKNIAFVNEGLEEDTLPPVIDDYAFDTPSIDTTDAAVDLTMYIRVSDDMSNVNLFSGESPVSPQIVFTANNDPGYAIPEDKVFEFAMMTEGCDALPEGFDVSGLTGCGDETDGIYSATVEIPRYSSGGVWTATSVSNLKDDLGNALESVSATFENLSTEYDLTAPDVIGVTITPSEFDTTSSAKTITFDVQIEDDLAGVGTVSIGLIPVIAGMGEGYWFEEYTINSGNALNGVFRLQVELPQGAPIGFWRVNNIDVGDALGRSQRYTTSTLSLAFPDLPLYLVNQSTTDSVTLQGDWTLEDWPYYQEDTVVWPEISVRFTEGTVITKEAGGIFAFHRMLATKYDLGATGLSALLSTVNSEYTSDLSDCDVAEGCVSTTVNDASLVGTPLHIMKVGIPGLNLSFSLPVTIIIGVDPEYLGETFVIQTFDEGENKWIDHGTCTVAMVVPPSTEHGGDAYGIIKPIAYAGCSFTTTHASFFSANVLGLEDSAAGVPNTGLGGMEKPSLTEHFEWLR